MNTRSTLLLSLIVLSTSTTAFAHDPSEHKNDSEQPNCEALNTMDHTKMDVNDPIIQAIMEQCGTHHNHEQNHQDKSKKSAVNKSDQ